MEQVTMLTPQEAVRLDAQHLGALYTQLGGAEAEEVICRAMEELALRLTYADRVYRSNDAVLLRKTARTIAAIAEQIGLHMLAQVARDVAGTVDAADRVAIAATMARLLRIGGASLTSVLDLQDMSL